MVIKWRMLGVVDSGLQSPLLRCSWQEGSFRRHATKGKGTGKEQQIEPDLDEKAVHTDGD